jgi:hypothetical protein
VASSGFLTYLPGNAFLLMAQILERHAQELEERAIITVRGGRIRVSKSTKP